MFCLASAELVFISCVTNYLWSKMIPKSIYTLLYTFVIRLDFVPMRKKETSKTCENKLIKKSIFLSFVKIYQVFY